ncbi:MAG TPA: orotidine-5'-phosphate decarboxylase [Pirellulales bacterium]|nr:orotidine-5'-phosphate decarboxylase [Pirellulales bacterium]
MDFTDRLAAAVTRFRNPVVVGLDPRWNDLPDGLKASFDGETTTGRAAGYATFCREVIDVVAPLVPVVKPQAAFFEQLGPPGMQALADTIAYARQRGLLVILDGKRNDIGSTATAYADGILGESSAWLADALTVSPYLGDDSLQPFFAVAGQRQSGIFVLVKTSNPGGRQFQDLDCGGKPLYRHVADYLETLARPAAGACGYAGIGAVVGATYPQQLAELRTALAHAWLLVPGYGSQGGTARDVAPAFDAHGLGALVNNSRGIIFAYREPRFAAGLSAGQWQSAIARSTRDMIAQLAAETTTGRL